VVIPAPTAVAQTFSGAIGNTTFGGGDHAFPAVYLDHGERPDR
jgi:hypothetical protein